MTLLRGVVVASLGLVLSMVNQTTGRGTFEPLKESPHSAWARDAPPSTCGALGAESLRGRRGVRPGSERW